MLVKFFNRGEGSGSGAVDYLTRLTDPKTKQLRDPAPQVLRGGIPSNTASITDRLKFKYKYNSGVLSFATEDAPTEEEQQELIEDFEAIAFPGIKEENRNILWVRHEHTGNNRVELHFLTPKVELSTAKSLNIAPPGWHGYFKPWQTFWNLKKGWARPDDPARARTSSPGHTEFKAKRKAARGEKMPQDTRARATAVVEKAISLGKVKDRTGVLKALKDNGLEILRATNKSVTIKNQEWDGNPQASQARVRLKSQTFYADWTLENQLNPPAIDSKALEIASLKDKIRRQAEARRKLNQELFPSNAIPEKELSPRNFTSFAEMLVDDLGARASVSPQTIDRAKKQRDELQDFKVKINLVGLAISEGFAKIDQESSPSSIKLKHSNGSVIVVKPGDNDVYFSPNGSLASGTVIDFVQQHHQVNLGQARKILREYLGREKKQQALRKRKQNNRQVAKRILGEGLARLQSQARQKQKQEKKVVAETFRVENYQNLKRHKYLELQRQISHRTFGDDRFTGQVLVDELYNAVFPYRDAERITGYEFRNADFKGFGKGGKKSLWQSNQKPNDDKLVIVESPIDALSYHQLNPNRQARYIATGGTMSAQQKQLLREQIRKLTDQRKTIIIATDNDSGGDKLASEIINLLPSKTYLFQKREKAKLKDWNADLIAKYFLSEQRDIQQRKRNKPKDIQL
ncbi:MAG: toprim domain-containing protein [Cyanobacteria bacterium P01_C01_bin.72]